MLLALKVVILVILFLSFVFKYSIFNLIIKAK